MPWSLTLDFLFNLRAQDAFLEIVFLGWFEGLLYLKNSVLFLSYGFSLSREMSPLGVPIL